jgi:hypothetical protein
MRSVRQNVLPAPGPARTRSDRGSDSIASFCDGDGSSYRVQITIDPQAVDDMRSYCAGIVPGFE